MQRRLLESLRSPAAAVAPDPPGPLPKGLSNQEIAAHLHVSETTVKTHINNLFSKTGVRDRAQAVRYAYDHGLATAQN